jgi:hypothetical protein
MTDLSAGLATLTTGTAAELLTTDNLDEMKFIALNRANPKLRPIRSEKNGRHYFIVYAHPLAFRDLKRSTAMQQAQREVSLQMENERLFKGGDLHWDGLIIKEAYDLYEYSTLTGLGDSGTTTVVPAFLVGAQAIGAAYAKRWTSKEDDLRHRCRRSHQSERPRRPDWLLRQLDRQLTRRPDNGYRYCFL